MIRFENQIITSLYLLIKTSKDIICTCKLRVVWSLYRGYENNIIHYRLNILGWFDEDKKKQILKVSRQSKKVYP